MPKFIVQVRIRESYEVEAEDARDAEEKLRSNHAQYRSGTMYQDPYTYKGYYADVKPDHILECYQPIQFLGASHIQKEAIPYLSNFDEEEGVE